MCGHCELLIVLDVVDFFHWITRVSDVRLQPSRPVGLFIVYFPKRTSSDYHGRMNIWRMLDKILVLLLALLDGSFQSESPGKN
ncbi:hypothetical protein BgiMline_010733, partial [Biomphalaria glabrata]